jgi:glutathione S-transferase
MAEFTLVIGNKTYSSWSLRGWLAARLAGIAFEERLVRLSEPGARAALLAQSPAGKVPVLHHGGRVVWDSLAIVEYLAEQRPDAGLWPEDPAARAHARSIAAEMHAGFAALRRHMPMNLRKSLPGRGQGPGVAQDIERISALWQDCRRRFGGQDGGAGGGPFLFGRAGAVDAMYAPVATRFRTYGVALDPVAAAYVEAIHAWPLFREWQAAALEEPWIIAEDEVA